MPNGGTTRAGVTTMKNRRTKTPCVLNPAAFCQRAEKRQRKSIKFRRLSQTDLYFALGDRPFHPVRYVTKIKIKPIFGVSHLKTGSPMDRGAKPSQKRKETAKNECHEIFHPYTNGRKTQTKGRRVPDSRSGKPLLYRLRAAKLQQEGTFLQIIGVVL